MELCFVFGSLAPHGPLVPDHESTAARPDFNDQYPIDIFRLFLLDQLSVNQQASPLVWYVQNVISTIWDMGTTPHPEFPGRRQVVKDVSSSPGESSYISPPPAPIMPTETNPPPNAIRRDFRAQNGGFFELRQWVAGSFSTCNAFDLAAITQLACSIALDNDGNEILDSRWVTGVGNPSLGQHDFGYMSPGVLFGWPKYPQANSPVFNQGAAITAVNEDRRPHTIHAWIEVKVPGSAAYAVLDPSQAIGPPPQAPPAGTMTRREYLAAKIDRKWPTPTRITTMDGRTNSDYILCRMLDKTKLSK